MCLVYLVMDCMDVLGDKSRCSLTQYGWVIINCIGLRSVFDAVFIGHEYGFESNFELEMTYFHTKLYAGGIFFKSSHLNCSFLLKT